MKNTKLFEDEILSSIGSITDTTLESEMSVLESMIDSYDKALMIMENYNGEDIEAFRIFQEADEAAVQQGDPDTSNSADAKKQQEPEKENAFIKIISFLPKLIIQFFQFLKKIWNEKIGDKLDDLAGKVNNSSDQAKEAVKECMDKDENGIKEWINKHPILSKLGARALGFLIAAILLATGALGKIFSLVESFVNGGRDFFTNIGKKSLFKKTSVNESGVLTTNFNFNEFNRLFGTEAKELFDTISGLTPEIGPEQIVSTCEKAVNDIKNIQSINLLSEEAVNFDATTIFKSITSMKEGMNGIQESAQKAADHIEKWVEKNKKDKNANKEASEALAGLSKRLNKIVKVLMQASDMSSKIVDELQNYVKGTGQIDEIIKNATNEDGAETDPVVDTNMPSAGETEKMISAYEQYGEMIKKMMKERGKNEGDPLSDEELTNIRNSIASQNGLDPDKFAAYVDGKKKKLTKTAVKKGAKKTFKELDKNLKKAVKKYHEVIKRNEPKLSEARPKAKENYINNVLGQLAENYGVDLEELRSAVNDYAVAESYEFDFDDNDLMFIEGFEVDDFTEDEDNGTGWWNR